MFDVIDEEPLGAASLAQCHRGVLKNGQIVAVKIQHPHVLKNGFTDMETVDVRRERERERERKFITIFYLVFGLLHCQTISKFPVPVVSRGSAEEPPQ